MLTNVQRLFLAGLAVGVNVSDMLPEPKQPKVVTGWDLARIEAAKFKRDRKNQKRLGIIKGEV
jgi:hypothetical protein